MKYSLINIFGFDSSIYSSMPFYCKDLKECWGSRVDTFVFTKENGKEAIKFNFVLSGEKYGVIMIAQNDKGDYKGRIICDGENVGSCFYTHYKNPTRNIFWGEWVQNGFTWNSLIELIK